MKKNVLFLLCVLSFSSVHAMDRSEYMSLRLDALAQLRKFQDLAEKMSKSQNQDCRRLGGTIENAILHVGEAYGELTEMESQGKQFPSIYVGFSEILEKGFASFGKKFGCF